MDFREVWEKNKILIVGIILWLFLRNRGGFSTFKSMDVAFVIFLAGYFIYGWWTGALKYKTPQFIADNFHASISDSPIIKNGWVIVRYGGVRADGIFMKGNDGVVIVPLYSINYVGDNIVSNVMVEPYYLNNLPLAVQNHLDTMGLSLSVRNIYSGYFPVTLSAHESEFQQFIDNDKYHNNLLGIQNELLNDKFERVKTISSDMSLVIDNLTAQDNVLKKMWKQLKEEKRED